MPPKSQIPPHTPTQCDTSNFAIVIPAPGVPANTNVFMGWLRREFYKFLAIIFVIPACAGMTRE